VGELIAIRHSPVGENTVNTVNARDLHSFLGVEKDFSDWIKAQIKRARLAEGRDFILVPFWGEQKGRGGHNRTEYHLTLEAGKHIAMLSGTEKGFQVREYFIECERKALTVTKALPSNYKEALLQLVEQVEANEQLALVVEEQKPKVAALERITNADGFLCITDTAKTLQIRPKDLFSWLSANNWIYRRAGGRGWLAYQPRIQQGVLSHKVTTVERSDGTEKTVEQVLVTSKGLSVLAEKLSYARA
jgi:anti-repressor protein